MESDRAFTARRMARYTRPTGAVVIGGLLAHAGFALAPTWTELEVGTLLVAASSVGVLILVGLFLAVYGLFIGIERAMFQGWDRSVKDADPP